MMDEAIGNLTCTLNTYGYNENTYLIITSDNGGDPSAVGSSYPYKGDHSCCLCPASIPNTPTPITLDRTLILPQPTHNLNSHHTLSSLDVQQAQRVPHGTVV